LCRILDPIYISKGKIKMIRHIVMFKIKADRPESVKKENLKKLKKMIDDLKERIPEIYRLETGMNISTRPIAYDLVLVSDFKTSEDLDAYIAHPDHQKLVDYLNTIRESVAVVDYII
jgi:hypothetical protein